jgi:hypothetical protein
MRENAPTMQSTLRFLRIVHLILAGSILLYWQLMSLVPAQNPETLQPVFLWSLSALSVAELAIGQLMRSRELRIAFEILRTKPDDAASLGRWRRGIIVSDCLALSVVLYGLAVHFLGGTGVQVAPFFIAGAATFLVWWPKQP